MGAVETRPSRKMPIRILGVFSQRSSLFLLLTMDCGKRMKDKKKAGRKIAQPFWG